MPSSWSVSRRPIVLATVLFVLAACGSKQEPPPATTTQPETTEPQAYPRYEPQPLPRDGRIIVNAWEYPWSAFGRVNTGGHGFCTGLLIGPALVLASAPCLYYGVEGRWWHESEMHFVAGYQRDEYLANSPIADVRVPAGFKPGQGATLGNLANSWALLTLESPMGRKAGWLGLSALNGGLRQRAAAGAALLLQAGYRPDRQHVLLLNLGCGPAGPLQGLPGLAPDCRRSPSDLGLPPLLLAGGTAAAAATESAQLTQALAAAGLAAPSAGRATSLPTRSVDQFLAFLGYLPTDPVGQAAERSEAIRAFQARVGMSPDGQPSLQLLEELIHAVLPQPPVS